MNRVYRLALPIAVLLLAACGTVATPVWSEQAQGTEAALLVTSEYQTQIAPTATPTPLSDPIATFIEGVEVRIGPDLLFSRPIGSFSSGATADILAVTSSGNWYKVQYFNQAGWVPSQSLTVSGDTTRIPIDDGPPIPTLTPTVAPPTEPPTAAPTLPPPTVAPAAASGSGDVEAGRELFNEVRGEVNFACATCHYVDREDMLIGPGLLNVAVRAETRVAGQTADEYLHNSILHPGDYVVEGFPDGLMPQVYGDIFSDEQINNLVAYLKTLQ